MDQIHSSRTHPAPKTQDPLPCEVVSGGTRINTREWGFPNGGKQAQPACFGVNQLRIPERSESDRLCSACMSLGRLDSTYWQEINNFREVIVDHHHYFDALFRSAHEGCHLCGLLLMAWEEKMEREQRGKWVGNRQYGSASLNKSIRLIFKRFHGPTLMTGDVIDEIQITLLCGEASSGRLICKAMDNDHRALPETCLPSGDDNNTGSSASFARIKAWLDICTNSHPACSQVDSQPPPLPTRVIAVGSKCSSKCYLVSGSNKDGHYATLSHCWGDPLNRPLSTTDQTLSCRQRGIEDEALPKTFRHAIQVCREIGIEHIWIDSLCIIQEQETQEDWAKEAPRMGHVYGNSILNISATTAADCTQGLFKERLGLNSWPCPMVLFGQACYLFRYPMIQEEHWGDPEQPSCDESNVLARRAWVLQEQILSRRSIIFSNNRLIWRCPTLSTNEKYPLGIPHAPRISVDNYHNLHCIVNGITSFMPKAPTFNNYACWYRTVEEFQSRDLTYEEDRLPAIAGIAKIFGEVVNDSYHAGLWRHDIILGLLWYVISDISKRKTKPAQIPSWSWASITGEVHYPPRLSVHTDASRHPLSPMIDVLSVSDPTTCKDHPFEVTSAASLSLSGVLLEVMQGEQDEYGESKLVLVENGTRVSDRIGHFYPDIGDSYMQDQALLVCLPIGVYHEPNCQGIRDVGELCEASWKKPPRMGVDRYRRLNTLYCLILEAIEGNQDTYSRVGLCFVHDHIAIEMSKMALFGERGTITII